MWLQGKKHFYFTLFRSYLPNSLMLSQCTKVKFTLILTCSFLKKISSSTYTNSKEGFYKMSYFVQLFPFTLPKTEQHDGSNRFPRIHCISSFQGNNVTNHKADIYAQIRTLVEVHLPRTFWASDCTCRFTWFLKAFVVNKRRKIGHPTNCTFLSHKLYFKIRTTSRHFIIKRNNLMQAIDFRENILINFLGYNRLQPKVIPK